MICAAYVFLYDVDSLEDENEEALRMARRSVALISEMPEMVSGSYFVGPGGGCC